MFDQASAEVVTSTLALIHIVHEQTQLAYADTVWSPVPEITLSLMARRLGCALRRDDLDPSIQEFGLPGYLGVPIIVVNRRAKAGVQSLALRHGLAHLVAGELEPEAGCEVRFMSSVLDYTTLEERRADLFALADLIPERALAGHRRLEAWLIRQIKRYAPNWPFERIWDRTKLRLLLSQEMM
jgi:Zn-dependent peptidase ImmA (M78 family)